MNRLFLISFASIFVGLLVVSGCASPRSAEEVQASQSAALGTWEYRVTGFSGLNRGTLRIQRQNGRLVARFRDERRERLDARVTIRDNWMELRLDRVLISGRLQNNRYRATVEIPVWDVSTTQAFRRSASRGRGSMVASLTQAGGYRTNTSDYGCAPLLRESSYACSPLHPDEVRQ